MAIESIGFEITNRCNYACVHCLRSDIAPRKDLPEDLQSVIGPVNSRLDIPLHLVDKLIDEARPLHIPAVSFTGGEPTLHRQFPQIVKKFYDAGYEIAMVTNGTRFEKTYQTINPYRDRFRGFCFSMDGATAETMDQIRQKGSFVKSLQAISVCRAKKLPFCIQMVITATNRHELEAMAILASKVESEQLYLIPLQPTLQTTYKQMNVAPEDWYKIKQEIEELNAVYKVSIEPFVAFPNDDSPWVNCNALSMQAIYVDYRGNITFCCQLSEYADGDSMTDIIGNLEDNNLLDLYGDYVQMISSFQKEKLRKYKNGELTKLDAFPCWYCAKHFKKLNWMKRFPDDPWHDDAMISIDHEKISKST